MNYLRHIKLNKTITQTFLITMLTKPNVNKFKTRVSWTVQIKNIVDNNNEKREVVHNDIKITFWQNSYPFWHVWHAAAPSTWFFQSYIQVIIKQYSGIKRRFFLPRNWYSFAKAGLRINRSLTNRAFYLHKIDGFKGNGENHVLTGFHCNC